MEGAGSQRDIESIPWPVHHYSARRAYRADRARSTTLWTHFATSTHSRFWRTFTVRPRCIRHVS